MKRNLLITLALLAVLLLVGFTQTSRPQWEYKIIYLKDVHKYDKNQEELNSLGSQGWEIIAIDREAQEGTSFAGAAFYLKRAK